MQCNGMGHGCLYTKLAKLSLGLGDECSVMEWVMDVFIHTCTAIFGAK